MAAPTSTNEVTARKLSSSISALWAKIKSTFQPVADRVTSIRASSSATDTNYPSEKAVAAALESKAPSAVTSEVTIANGDKMIIADASDSSKLKRASAAFDGSTTKKFLNQKGTFTHVLEADLDWGGDFRNSKSPSEAYTRQNLWFCPKSSAVSIEYCTDRTSDNPTWLPYGETETDRQKLFSGGEETAAAFYCGKNTHVHPGYTGSISGTKDLTDDIVPDQGLRITICCRSLSSRDADVDSWSYGQIVRILMNVSTNSANGGPRHCKVETMTGANFKAGNDTWTDRGDYNLSGDSGWNSIPLQITFGGGWTQTSQIWVVRFTIWAEALRADPVSSQTGNLKINTIAALTKTTWTNDAMKRYGTPYSITATGGAVFKDIKFTARKLKTNLARTSDSTFDGSADQENIPVTGTLPVGNGGTGKTTAKAAEYNLTTGKSEISDTTSGDDRVVFELASPSESNGVTRGFRKLSTIWTWIKGLLSSESGVNISGTASGLSSTLAVGSGGTGKASVTAGNYVVGAGTSAMVEKTPKEVGSNVLSHLDTDVDAVQESDYIVASGHAEMQTDTTSFVRRTAAQLWTYIAYKIYSVLGLSASAYGGKSATAGTADTANAYDPTFSGTNSIASALESKVTEIAFTEGNASAATDLTNVVLCGLKFSGSSVSSGRLSFCLSLTINRGTQSKGGILRVDVATNSSGSAYSKRITLTARSGGLDVSEFYLVTGTNGGKPVIGVVWNGTTESGAYMDVRVLDYKVVSGTGSFIYDAVLSNKAQVYWGDGNRWQGASDEGVVHKAGTETISGVKEFARSGQFIDFTDTDGTKSDVRVRTSTSSPNGSAQLEANRTSGRYGVYAVNASGDNLWVACLDNDGVVNLGNSSHGARIAGTKFVFNASQLGTEADTFYWI